MSVLGFLAGCGKDSNASGPASGGVGAVVRSVPPSTSPLNGVATTGEPLLHEEMEAREVGTVDEWSVLLPTLRPDRLASGIYELGRVGTIDLAVVSDRGSVCLQAHHGDGSGTSICAGPEEASGYLDMSTSIDLEDGSPVETVVLLDSSVDFSLDLIDDDGREVPCELTRDPLGPVTVWACSYEEGRAALRYTAQVAGAATAVLLDTPAVEWRES